MAVIMLGAIGIFAVGVIWAAGTYLTKPVPMQFGSTPTGSVQVSFESKSGSTIKGWLYEANQVKAVAVLMHGVRSNRAQMTDRAEYFQARGITSLVFDFQAHGESGGTLITLGHLESLDAQAAVSYIQKLEPELPSLAIGVSMGGAASLLAEPAIDVDVLILESVYPDIKTAIANRLGSRIPGGEFLTPLLSAQIEPRIGISADKLSPVRAASRVTAATLVLSGEIDVRTTIEDTQRLFEALPAPKVLEIIDNAGHVDLAQFDPARYWLAVDAFLDQYLSLN